MAKLKTRVFAVVDGEFHPKWLEAGDTVTGSLETEMRAAGNVEDDGAQGSEQVSNPSSAAGEAGGAKIVNAGTGDAGPDEGAAGAGGESAVPAVVIPDNWKELTWPQLRSLGAKVKPGVEAKKESVVAAIEEYLAGKKPAEEQAPAAAE